MTRVALAPKAAQKNTHKPAPSMLKKLSVSVLLATALAGAFAASDSPIRPAPQHSAYLQDSDHRIVHSGTGLCWRSGYWTPADAVTGCDGALVPPVASPIAPPIVPPVAMQPQTPAAPAPAPAPCDFSVTLGSDHAFAFNRAGLNPAAKKWIDSEVIGRLDKCANVQAVRIIGHADRLGSRQYNLRLSQKRADAVAAYLKARGVAASISTRGAGESEPVQTCAGKMSRTKLVACLAPNRRVVIEAEGVAR
jgi:OOP family OmpA-OmpF porin